MGKKKWEIQEGETPKAYEAFCTYRDLGPTRSVSKALEKENKKRTNRGHWGRWIET